MDKLREALELHKAVAEELLQTAEGLPELRWHEPLAQGKWTPAQQMEHLNSTYDILLTELKGGLGMKVRTKLWQRLLLRLRIMPRIMKEGVFPAGAPAPEEIRPLNKPEKADAIAAFKVRSKTFAEAATTASPTQMITHAYFGSASVADGVTLCSRHIQHHQRQLKALSER